MCVCLRVCVRMRVWYVEMETPSFDRTKERQRERDGERGVEGETEKSRQKER